MNDERFSGVVERITFHNPETGYAVLKVKPVVGRAGGTLFGGAGRGLITVVGRTPTVTAGEQIEATGRWTEHKTHGRQFDATRIELTPPTSAEGIRRFLSGGAVRGIGPALAERIVAHFGEQTFDVLEHSPDFLLHIRGVGAGTLKRIKQGWEQTRDVRRLTVFLHDLGIGIGARAIRIHRAYGVDAIAVIQANPYRLADDIRGIGFKTADQIASKLGLPPDAPFRLESGVRFALSELAAAGHTGVPESLLVETAANLLGVELDLIEAAIKQGLEDGRLVRRAAPTVTVSLADSPPSAPVRSSAPRRRNPDGPVLVEDDAPDSDFTSPGDESEAFDFDAADPSADPMASDWVFSYPLDRAEQAVADALLRIAYAPTSGTRTVRRKATPPTTPAPLDVLTLDLTSALRCLEVAPAPAQIDAIRAAISHRVVVITGGPGTGKTTIVRGILAILRQLDRSVVLCAPTGRAAKRLTETTGTPAKTIHRLLEYDPNEGRFARNGQSQLTADAVILDEASMVDIPLASHLLSAIATGTTLILVGDVDQLPSVGPGQFLADVIASGRIPTVRLTEVFRQGTTSRILTAAHQVNRGAPPPMDTPRELADFYFIEETDPVRARDVIRRLVAERIEPRFGLDPRRAVQILAPMNRGPLGTIELNALIQDAVNPNPHLDAASPPAADATTSDDRDLVLHDTRYRVGDRVIQLENNYEKRVFNGDIGEILAINKIDQVVSIRYDELVAEYEYTDMDEVTLAYAITIHKSQGSEYPAVIIPWHTGHYVMLSRNLLYTAITRGRRLVVVVGHPQAIEIALKRRGATRHTALADRLNA